MGVRTTEWLPWYPPAWRGISLLKQPGQDWLGHRRSVRHLRECPGAVVVFHGTKSDCQRGWGIVGLAAMFARGVWAMTFRSSNSTRPSLCSVRVTS